MMQERVSQGDCLDLLPTYAAESFDSMVTDPPAGIGFMGKTWDKPGVLGVSGGVASPATANSSRNPTCQTCGGRKRAGAATKACVCTKPSWNDREWLRRDRRQFVAFLTAVFEECLRVLKPGAHAFVWAIPRTAHWTAWALEDAGFEIRDVVVHLFGQGFPKSHNLGDGWGTALKPAAEHWVLARKPTEGSAEANHAKWGTGGLNIDGCRIDTDWSERPESWKRSGHSSRPGETSMWGTGGGGIDTSQGRWPANVTLDEEAAALLDEVVGDRPSKMGGSDPSSGYWGNAGAATGVRRDDTGGPSRFFYTGKADRRERDAGLDDLEARPLLWSSGTKNPGSFPSEGTVKEARNNHPTVKPIALMRWLCRLVTPPGGLILDPFAGSGSTGVAAAIEGFGFVGIEQDERWAEIARRRIEWAKVPA